jgi:hypothetical protein
LDKPALVEILDMKGTALVASLCAFVLVGCASSPRLADSFKERTHPKVTVLNGRMAVAPDPLYFGRKEKGEITWEVPEKASYRFPPNGIVIEGRLIEPPQAVFGTDPAQATARGNLILDNNQQEIVCPAQEGGRKFKCTNRHTEPGIYKYSIRVRDGNREIVMDPFIINM